VSERLRLWPSATANVELEASAPSHRCRRGARGPREVPEVVTCLWRRNSGSAPCGGASAENGLALWETASERFAQGEKGRDGKTDLIGDSK
jgi:hypothetical protein